MALAADTWLHDDGAVNAPSLIDLANPAPPRAAAPNRAVMVWADDLATGRPWAMALSEEGVRTDIRAADDASAAPTAVDAWVLYSHSGLSANLGRLRALRACGTLPLMVSARGLRDLDQVLALEMGADDVVDAQLPMPVVAARLRALWRMAQGDARLQEPQELRFGALELSRRERQVHLRGERVPLTEGEFAVLWLLASHAGTTLPRRDILRRVRGLDDHPMDRSIDSRIYRIRHKLGDNTLPSPRIRTVRNLGYALTAAPW
jgi:DNA-binding response OmpR family regulator